MATESSADGSLLSRRRFVQAGIGLSAAGVVALGSAAKLLAADTVPESKARGPIIQPGDTVLFQGDSITDAKRKRDVKTANAQDGMGSGYAWLAAAQQLIDRPAAKLKFFNRGNSGNKVYQLAERWQTDCLDLKPDVVSILIGVNDYSHMLDGTFKTSAAKYEKEFRELLERTRGALPKVRLVVCEPFVLKTGKVTDKWFPGYDDFRAAARTVADQAEALFVPFQAMFDEASKIAAPALWAADGIHPTCEGAALMAHSWLKAVGA